jgi:peptide/nickel transport system permease protein
MTLHISNVAKVPVEKPFNGFVRPFIRSRRHGYLKFLVRRVAQSALLFFLTVLLTFTAINAAPGDMVDVMACDSGGADPGYVQLLRGKYGLDKPLPVRLFNYADQLAHLDLGYSFPQNAEVSDLIADRIGPTMLLMGSSLIVAVLGALLLGTLAAWNVHRKVDGLISVLTLLAYATPVFWVGLMLILLFSVKLGWFPSSGMETLFSGYTGFTRFKDIAWHLVLPALTLSLFHLALFTRLLRASLLEVLHQDYVRTARAKGLGEWRVLGIHALGNALLPLVTMVGVQIGASLGGAVVVESVFAWPGLGRLAFEALGARDTNLLVGIVLFSGLIVISVNLLVDLLYGWLDPRIENV